jgi:phage-related protein
MLDTIDNSIPIEVYNSTTNEKLDEFPSYFKFMRSYGVPRSSRNVYFLVSKKKNGENRTMFSKKLNERVYIKLKKL